MPILHFPKDFLWGAATSAHQVEGNTKNDWSEWEKKNATRLAQNSSQKFSHLARWEHIQPQAENPQNYISGQACDHYHRYEQDFDIAKSLGHNAHRFSIEWSRIEPEEGKWNEEAIEHYRGVLLSLRERGIEPFVTLWHWTLPLWLSEKSGLEKKEFAIFFERYTRFVVTRLHNHVKFWVTLNEPTSVIGASYIAGAWPPQKKSFFAAYRVFHILATAHKRAYRVIREIDSTAQVGFGNALHSFVPYRKESFIDYLSVRIAQFFTNKYMLRLTRGHHDFLTVQYYFHSRLKLISREHNVDHPESDLGWEIYPEGLYHILKWLGSFHLPIYITENGLADVLDEKRTAFIREHLKWTHKAIQEGVPVKGYFYWSLLDNFEWDKGFWPRFGLVAVDYATQVRTLRPSAFTYAKICKENALELPDK